MVITILAQVLVLPLVLSFLIFGLGRYQAKLRAHSSLAFVLTWLVSYCWVLNWPNFPPIVVQDWFWLIALAFGLGASFSQSNRWVFLGASLAAVAITLWPVISTQMTWLFALEIVILLIVIAVSFSSNAHQSSWLDYFCLTFLSGSLGVLTILSGSSLIGFLALGLASSHAAGALLGQRFNWLLDSRALVALNIVLLACIRTYVELHWLAAFCMALVLCLIARPMFRQGLRTALVAALLAIAIATVVYTEMLDSSSAAYY
jgi:hypothetical protein